MLDQIKKLFLTDTGKDTSIVFLGTLANAAIGGIFFILAPRILGPTQFGLFAVVTSTGILVANLANFGIDTGILKFAAQLDGLKRNRILKLALQAYLIIGVIVAILGFMAAKPLASFLGYENIVPLLRIAFAGTILFLLTDFFIAVLQSRRQFLKASLVNLYSNIGRLAILVLAAYFFTVNLYFLTVLFFSVIIVSVIIGKLFVPFDFLRAKGHLGEFKNFFGFNFWIAASLAISSFPLDHYLLIKFAGPLLTGIYAAPFKILSISDQLAGNLSRVLAPRFSSFSSDKEATVYAKKVVPIVVFVVIGFLLVGILANPLVRLLLGDQYIGSIGVFRIIALSYAFYFADTIAVSLIVYYFSKPKITFLITAIVITIWSVASFILIPKYQAIGAALANLISGITAFVLFSSYVIWQFSKRNNVSN